MKKAIFYRLTAVMLLIIMMLNVFCACSTDIFDWKDSWEDDSSDSVWGDGKDDVWDNTIDLAYHVNSVLLFEPEVTNEFPEIASFTLQYDKDGEYFDDAAAKLELGSQFNLNDLAKKMAVGSGVVIVCVLLNVATAGSTVPFACFIAGAAKGALYGSVTGLASEAAMRAITTAIKTGSAVDTMYSFIEGAVDGYKWGAIFGAITGGLASKYCFAENTKVKTKFGYTNIQDIKVGDLVWSRNLRTGKNELQPVTRIYINKTDEWVRFNTANGEIICTPGHQFYDGAQYRRIDLYKTDESIASFDGNSKIVSINKQL